MNITIRGVRDNGTLSDERLVLVVEEDLDIGEYCVADTTYIKEGTVSNKLRHFYWFPDKSIKKGDLVVLYTKSGKYSYRENKDGTKSHFFYWGLDNTVWNADGDCAVVFEIFSWKHKRVLPKE